MRPRHWSLLPLVAAAGTGALLAVAPLATISSCEASSAGETTCSSSSQSLVSSEGASVLVLLAVTVLVTLVPVLWPARWARAAPAVLLSGAALLALASIGIFLLPTVTLAWVAVVVTRDQEDPPGARPTVSVDPGSG